MFGLVRKKKVLDYAKEIKVENRAEDIYAKYPTEDVRQEKLNCYSQGYEDGTDKLMGGELCSQMDKINDIEDMLEDKARKDCELRVEKSESFRDGYIAACEEFGRQIRRAIRVEIN